MNLETNLQMLDKVNKYADYEFNFSKFSCKYLLSIEKSETEGLVETETVIFVSNSFYYHESDCDGRKYNNTVH